MNRDKQIEQMARVTCQMYTPQYEKRCAGVGKCDYKCLHYQRCEALYDTGYRKASEVAREICQDIIEPLWKAWKNDASQEKVLLVAMILETISYQLKKKYESEGADDEN